MRMKKKVKVIIGIIIVVVLVIAIGKISSHRVNTLANWSFNIMTAQMIIVSSSRYVIRKKEKLRHPEKLVFE